jgi:aspartokinase
MPLKASTRIRLEQVLSFVSPFITPQELSDIFTGLFDYQIQAITASGKCEARYMDAISSIGWPSNMAILSHFAGERLSTKLLAAYLNDQGTGATEVPADNVLMTTGDHGAAVPLLDKSLLTAKPVLSDILKNDCVFVLEDTHF